jgi:hypothetical protein
MENLYKYVIVAPCFENNEHRSGLDQNTRLRLTAAIIMFKKGRAQTIIVGGGKLRQMKESFAELMKKYLNKKGIPNCVIGTEEYTFDTASQIQWTSKNINTMDDITCFMTDSAQKKHIKALVEGFNIEECDVLSMESVILKNSNCYNFKYLYYFKEKFWNSFGWMVFEIREFLLFLFTKLFNPRNELLGKISIRRRT